jgi:WD40 repeat protein
MILRKLFFGGLVFFLLASCSASAPQPSAESLLISPTQKVLRAPTLVEPTSAMLSQPSETPAITPTEILPTPIEQPDSQISSQVINPVNSLQLQRWAELTLDEPARIVWNNDQSSFWLVQYTGFQVMSFPDLSQIFSLTMQPDEILVDVSPDGLTYAITYNNQGLLLVNWRDQHIRSAHTEHAFMGGQFSPDGTKIMLPQTDTWAGMVVEATSGEELTTISGFETAAPIYNVRIGEDNRHAIWNARATIQLSDIATNTIGPALYHSDFISAYTLSPDGRFLAVSVYDLINDVMTPVVIFYDVNTGEILQKIATNQSAFDLKFSPDSSLLAAAQNDQIVFIDSENKQIIGNFLLDQNDINQVSFAPQGNILVTLSTNGSVVFWHIP